MKRGLTVAGLLVLALAWGGPLPAMARTSFSAHMTMHMTVVAIAAPLLAIGIAGSRLDPVRRHAPLFAPIPASIGELIVVWVWHAPELHHAARHGVAGLILEQSMFLAAGLWVWLAAFGGSREQRRSRAGSGIVALLLTSMHMTLLGALLALTPRPLYQHTAASAFGLSALGDQHLGGSIMLLVGGAAYLAGGLMLAAGLVRDRAEEGVLHDS